MSALSSMWFPSRSPFKPPWITLPLSGARQGGRGHRQFRGGRAKAGAGDYRRQGRRCRGGPRRRRTGRPGETTGWCIVTAMYPHRWSDAAMSPVGCEIAGQAGSQLTHSCLQLVVWRGSPAARASTRRWTMSAAPVRRGLTRDPPIDLKEITSGKAINAAVDLVGNELAGQVGFPIKTLFFLDICVPVSAAAGRCAVAVGRADRQHGDMLLAERGSRGGRFRLGFRILTSSEKTWSSCRRCRRCRAAASSLAVRHAQLRH